MHQAIQCVILLVRWGGGSDENLSLSTTRSRQLVELSYRWTLINTSI